MTSGRKELVGVQKHSLEFNIFWEQASGRKSYWTLKGFTFFLSFSDLAQWIYNCPKTKCILFHWTSSGLNCSCGWQDIDGIIITSGCFQWNHPDLFETYWNQITVCPTVSAIKKLRSPLLIWRVLFCPIIVMVFSWLQTDRNGKLSISETAKQVLFLEHVAFLMVKRRLKMVFLLVHLDVFRFYNVFLQIQLNISYWFYKIKSYHGLRMNLAILFTTDMSRHLSGQEGVVNISRVLS